MARRPRASRLETRTTRLKLPVRPKPHDFSTIAPGIALGYRRNKAAGVWVVRVADGHGGNWTKRVALADDFEESDTGTCDLVGGHRSGAPRRPWLRRHRPASDRQGCDRRV